MSDNRQVILEGLYNGTVLGEAQSSLKMEEFSEEKPMPTAPTFKAMGSITGRSTGPEFKEFPKGWGPLDTEEEKVEPVGIQSLRRKRGKDE